MATATKSQKTTRQPERIVNDAPRTFTDADWPVGSVAHQGDLILVRLESLPDGKPRNNRQMAEGDTQGSRHVLTTGNPFDCTPAAVVAAIKKVCPKSDVKDQYIGPVFQSVNDRAELLHPEHGDHLYEGHMVIACVYQRNLDAEQQEQRTRD